MSSINDYTEHIAWLNEMVPVEGGQDARGFRVEEPPGEKPLFIILQDASLRDVNILFTNRGDRIAVEASAAPTVHVCIARLDPSRMPFVIKEPRVPTI